MESQRHTLDAIANYTPKPNRPKQQKIKDRLFAYPAESTPDSLKTLYVIAWRCIIRDFYRMEFESHTYHYIPVLETTLIRFTTLVRSIAPPNGHYRMRTRTVARWPRAGNLSKLKRPLELSAPTFTENDKGNLTMNDNLGLVAKALGLAEKLA